MTLKQLEYFRTICQYNNISRAADALYVSQPSLSNTVKELEKEFGVSLFRRVSKGLVPTEEGQVLLEETTKLLEQANHLTKRMHQFGQNQQTIRLGVPPMLATLIFPAFLQAFHSVCPDIHLQMVENGTLTNKTLVRDGSIDAAIVSSDSPLPADFASSLLCSMNICLYVPSGLTPAGSTFQDLVNTCPVPQVCLTEDSFLTNYITRQFKIYQLHPDIILHTNQLSTIRQMIENKMAAAFLFDHVMDENERIVKIPVPDLPQMQARLVWSAGRKPSKAFQRLIRLSRSESFLSGLTRDTSIL